MYFAEASSLGIIEGASATSVTHSTSGMGGLVATAGERVEMSLNSNDKTQGIRLRNEIIGSTALDTLFIVRYGNTKQSNPKRDQDDTFYPTGK